jgi:hypothetical protein
MSADPVPAPEPVPAQLAVRVLRAKVGELQAHVLGADPGDQLAWLAADVALVAGLLAELVERVDALIEHGPA